MNFDYLSVFGSNVSGRFETLMKNVYAASPSFYDSFLNLLEPLVKEALTEENYPFKEGKNTGYLLNNPEVRAFLEEHHGVDQALSKKMHDLVLKANHHKHSKEKTLVIESILSFMEPFHRFASALAHKKLENNAFDETFFRESYGRLLKENEQLKVRVESLMGEVEALAEKNQIGQEQLQKTRDLSELLAQEKDEEIRNRKYHEAIAVLTMSARAEELQGLRKDVDRLMGKETEQPAKKEAEQQRKWLEEITAFMKGAEVYYFEGFDGRLAENGGRLKLWGYLSLAVALGLFLYGFFVPGLMKLRILYGAILIACCVICLLAGYRMGSEKIINPRSFFSVARGKVEWVDGRMSVYGFAGVLTPSGFEDKTGEPFRWEWMYRTLYYATLIWMWIVPVVDGFMEHSYLNSLYLQVDVLFLLLITALFGVMHHYLYKHPLPTCAIFQNGKKKICFHLYKRSFVSLPPFLGGKDEEGLPS